MAAPTKPGKLAEWYGLNPLWAYRKARGLKRSDAADYIGVDVGTIWRWETGQNSPHANHYATIKGYIQWPADADSLLERWNQWRKSKP